MNLALLDTLFSVVRLSPASAVPAWTLEGEVFSITRTAEELSVVCPSTCLPEGELTDVERDWSCIKIAAVMDFSLTGILASLANPLADNGISIFAVSTYNTDYLFIKSHSLEKAKSVLVSAGHTFING